MALRYNIVLDQGSDFEIVWPIFGPTGTAQNVVGWSASMQVRESADAADTLVDLAGRLTVGGSSVTLSIPGNVSSDWEWRYGYYDLELANPGGAVSRIAYGRFVGTPEITR